MGEAELHDHHGRAFDAVDVDENSEISPEEFAAAFAAGTKERGESFRELDHDSNGFLDLYEFSGTTAHAPEGEYQVDEPSGHENTATDHDKGGAGAHDHADAPDP